MTINFANLPANARVPGFYAEVDPTHANSGQRAHRTLIIGTTSAGAIVPAVPGPVLMASLVQARTVGGAGSMLHAMAVEYRGQDAYGEVWLLPVAEPAAGTAGTAGATLVTVNNAPGTLSCYVCGTRVQVPVAALTPATALAAALAAAVNANPDLPMTAAVNVGSTVTFTMRWKGADDLDVRFNALGAAGGEALPLGVTISPALGITPGTAAPDIGPALATLGDLPFDLIVMPYTDSASLDALRTFLGDSAGRWAPQRLLFGHAVYALRGTLGAVTTLLTARNDQHASCLPFPDSRDPAWIWAADLAGTIAGSLRNDPGLPLQHMAMGVAAPAPGLRWGWGERNTLLYDGAGAFEVAPDGTVMLLRLPTTYQRNPSGVPDDSYLDTETMFQLQDVIQFLQADITTTFARKKLVSDQTRFGLNNPDTVTPAILKTHILALYRLLELQGRVQDSATFKAGLIVENAGGGRVNILAPILLAQQLRIIAISVQFVKP